MAIEYPQINGFRPSWASIEIVINGKRYAGVKSINWKGGGEPGAVAGTGQVDIGRTRGKYKASGDMEIYLDEFEDIIKELGNGWQNKPIDIDTQWSEEGRATTHVQLRSVLLSEDDWSNADGTDASAVKLTLSMFLPVLTNGINPIESE